MVQRSRGAAALVLLAVGLSACGSGGGSASAPAASTEGAPVGSTSTTQTHGGGTTSSAGSGSGASGRKTQAEQPFAAGRVSAAVVLREHRVEIRTNDRCGALRRHVGRRPTQGGPRELARYAAAALPVTQDMVATLIRTRQASSRARQGLHELQGAVGVLLSVYQRVLASQGHVPLAQVTAYEQRATLIARAVQLPLCAPPWA